MNNDKSPFDKILLKELGRLRKENQQLKKTIQDLQDESYQQTFSPVSLFDEPIQELKAIMGYKVIDQNSSIEEKITLLLSLFHGRLDVYAKRWEIRSHERVGYSPVCIHEWVKGKCFKPSIRCSECDNRVFAPFDHTAVRKHLLGKMIIGIYPLLSDETCHFLAIDFDGKNWMQNVYVLRKTCQIHQIPCAIERSRSGNGAHVWFFFETPISAHLVRRFGSALITETMQRNYQIGFESYDRLFPNQDTLPKGGLGNLIALPFQKEAMEQQNSVFINENFIPYEDQWVYLSNIERIEKASLLKTIKMLSQDHEMGTLRDNEETGEINGEKQSWAKDSKTMLIAEKWPSSAHIVIADNIYIEKEGLSHRVLNLLIRMAAFKNPEFYKAQALRLSTFGKPRIIHLAEEDEKNLILPRGCLEEVKNFFDNNEVNVIIQDNTASGMPISIHFIGKLNVAQEQAAIKLNTYQTGILSAIPAFGKTVIGTWLIAEKKVNTLILVHRQQLLDQWVERLKQFLSPISIGTIGGGKFNPRMEIDVALLQSMTDGGDVRSLIKSYGMVIVDECHHISAFSFEKVIKAANAKYLYGFTATPTRKDGHHPIISMRLGPIRYSVSIKQYAQTVPFQHIVSPKITTFTLPPKEEGYRIQDIYEKISVDESRNSQIIQDALQAWKDKRNVLILCDRVKHAELLKNRLEEEIGDLIFMSGRLKKKERQIIQTELTSSIKQKPRFIIATGKYIGEGFDDSCLDTLFLTSPVAWYGTIHQYIGRLHRFHENKKEVRVYDYVDLHVPVLERMFYKRVKAYREAGYTVKPMDTKWIEIGYLFESDDYFETFVKDLLEARKQVLIMSAHIDKARIESLKQTFNSMREKQIKVKIITEEKPNFILDSLCSEGIDIEYNNQGSKQYAVIDQRIVWYGPLELLANPTKSGNVLRIEDSSLAKNLLEFSFEKYHASNMTDSNILTL